MRRIFLMSSVLFVAPFVFGEMGEASAQCVATTDCASLGYTETSCPNGGIKCPFGNTWSCKGTGGDGKDDVTVDNKVSAIYYSDGTISPNILPGKTAIGVVGYANGEHGLVIALEEARLVWAGRGAGRGEEEKYDIPCLINHALGSEGDSNGKANTACIIKTAQEKGWSYPAAEYCYQYNTEGKGTGEWYLPGAQEFIRVEKNQSEINETLKKLGASALNRKTSTGSIDSYWTSNELDYVIAGGTVKTVTQFASSSEASKYLSLPVRCMFSY